MERRTMADIIKPSSFHIGATPGSKGWTGSKMGIVYKIPANLLRQIQRDNPGIMQSPAKFDKIMKSYELQGMNIHGE